MDTRGFIEKILKESGDVVKASFGEVIPSKKKIEKTQIVTDVDVASERLLIESITQAYPQSGIIAEESGFISSKDNTFWIIDPIDGTSNFANAIPWFGVMVAFVEDHTLTHGGIYLPLTDEMYSAKLGEGAYKNGEVIKNPSQVILSDSLVSVCFSSDSDEYIKRESRILSVLSKHVLNIRSTNSAYDYAYACDGKLAAVINQKNKIWDVAPVSVIAKEAGMKISDMDGKPLYYSFSQENYLKDYSLFVANPHIYDEILATLV